MENVVIDQDMGDGRMTITPEISNFLRETAKWAKFIAIVGFVMVGLFVVLALFMGTIMGSMGSGLSDAGLVGAMPGAFLSIIYIVFAAIYFFPILYLYRFATKMQLALKNDDQAFLSNSFMNLKKCYKFMGIFMAILLGFYALMLVIGLVAGGAAAFM